MLVIIIFGVFETILYPPSIFAEEQFNPAFTSAEDIFFMAGVGTKFELAELRTYTLFSALNDFKFSIHSLGYDLYRENSFYLGYRFPLREKWTVGFCVGLLNNWVYENHNRFTYALRLASVYQISNIRFSGWLNNINAPKFTSVDRLPISYTIRYDYLVGTTFTFACAVRGQSKDEPFFNISFSALPYKFVTLGVGVNTDPIYLEYGMALKIGKINLNYIGSNHQHLGLSHAFYIVLLP